MKDKYLYWLDRVEGLGTLAKINLMEAFGNAKEVYEGPERLIKCILDEKKQKIFFKAKEEVEVERAFEAANQKGVEMVCCFDKTFPQKLQNIPDRPFSLYYKGRLPQNELPAVAVIGARECSQYGEYIAEELGSLLGNQGIQVISGMAKGIDGISQLAALEEGGISFGVLGCGVDICYPKSNRRLYEKLIATGGIISTYPPGTQPQARLFPPRNRIVSGLADVLVVIEARQKSGTYITVEMALEQGREIYAVPGRVTDRLSDGCNKMLKDGAHVFLSPQDFLIDLQELMPFRMGALQRTQCKKDVGNLQDNKVVPQNEYIQMTLDDAQEQNSQEQNSQEDILSKALMEIVDFYPQSIENIALQLKEKYQITQKPEELTIKLMHMCLFGYVEQESAGWFSKNKK